MPMPTDVRTRELTHAFGDTPALRGLTFEVERGELFGFIGPDGAGKTTLFRILVTLIEPDAGAAEVLGHDVVRDLWEVRRRVGYMPGRFSLYPDLTVEENLSFFASVFGTTIGEQYDRIAPIYHQIEPFADRRADALSGGMKQKLALSCALVHEPEILFLDEPTTGVDAVSRREFWDVLQQYRDAGMTIVVSTPYMDEADRCDRVALIDDGRILRIDRPGAIGGSYDRPLFAVRGGSADDRYAILQALRGLPHAVSVYPFGASIHYTDGRDEEPDGEAAAALAADIESRLADAGFPGAEVRPIRAGIEDVFMALMGRAS